LVTPAVIIYFAACALSPAVGNSPSPAANLLITSPVIKVFLPVAAVPSAVIIIVGICSRAKT
jgi:hypothetical protein